MIISANKPNPTGHRKLKPQTLTFRQTSSHTDSKRRDFIEHPIQNREQIQ